MLKIDKVSRRFGNKTAVDKRRLSKFPKARWSASSAAPAPASRRLLRMINRLIDPSDGSILFRGRDVTALKGAALRAWRADCAMIFQQFNLVPRLDVLTNVLLGRLN